MTGTPQPIDRCFMNAKMAGCSGICMHNLPVLTTSAVYINACRHCLPGLMHTHGAVMHTRRAVMHTRSAVMHTHSAVMRTRSAVAHGRILPYLGSRPASPLPAGNAITSGTEIESL